jgi:hypothetical protein
MTLPRLNSLWVGRELKYLERLCLVSARAAGHEFVLWSYDPEQLRGVPDGFEVRDAAEVMPREGLLRYRDTGSVALGANLWRIQLLAKGLGYWVDMDFIFLKALDFDDPYVFGLERGGWINNALLCAPAESGFVRDLLAIPRPNVRPPWFGPRRTLQFYWERLRGRRIGLEDMPWGTYSAGLVTHCVKKNGLIAHARPAEVFYPVTWDEAKMIYGPAKAVEALVTPETRAVHMWHSRLERLVDAPPPAGSYVDVMCRRFGIATDDAATSA